MNAFRSQIQKILQTTTLGGIVWAALFIPAFAFAAGTTDSLNWAGYASLTNAPYTAVSGSWIVPASTADASSEHLSADAVWVGIGGVRTRDLIQAGTQAIIGASGVSYVAWYELLPDTAVTVPLSIHSGDSVSVSISEISQGSWHIILFNNSTGQSYQTTVQYSSSHASAEWIIEAPASSHGILPLDYFGSVSFTAAGAVANGVSTTPGSLGAVAFTMIDTHGNTLASPSALGGDGASFSVSRTGNAPTPTSIVTPQITKPSIPVPPILPPPAPKGIPDATQTPETNNSATASENPNWHRDQDIQSHHHSRWNWFGRYDRSNTQTFSRLRTNGDNNH